LVVVSLDGVLSLWDGVLLLAGLVLHAVMSIVVGRKESQQATTVASEMPLNSKPVRLWLAIILVIAGVGLLVAGAQALVTGAVNIATDLGVSSLVIGLTVVAIGTSLPELATSIVALRRGERDMAVGNIVGSNIFNIGLVLGLPAILFAEGIPIPDAAIALDLPLMLAAAVALLPIAFYRIHHCPMGRLIVCGALCRLPGSTWFLPLPSTTLPPGSRRSCCGLCFLWSPPLSSPLPPTK
jgi:cation:H+ antiporter